MAPKRSSTAPKATSPRRQPPAKRAKTSGPEAPLLDFIGKCDEIPKPCREMLQVSVPICLEVVEAERHKFQVEVLDRVGALLATVESKKREGIKEDETELKEIEGEKDAEIVALDQKNAAADAKQKESDEKGKVVDGVREVRNEAQKVLTDAKNAEEAFNKKKEELVAEQDSFAKLLSDVFQPLKEGTMQGNWQKRNKLIGELKKKLSELGCQDSLGDALAQTLKMTPEKREGSFAQVTMKFVEDAFNKHTTQVASDIGGLDAEAAKHKADIEAAEATLGLKQADLTAIEKEFDALQDVWVTLSDDAAKAQKSLRSVEARIPKVEKKIEKGQADLEKFLEVPALFAKLKERSTAAPEEPEAAEEAEKPEEEKPEEENAGEGQPGENADEEMQAAS